MQKEIPGKVPGNKIDTKTGAFSTIFSNYFRREEFFETPWRKYKQWHNNWHTAKKFDQI